MHTPGPWKRTGGGGIAACMESETLKSGRRISRRVACAKGISITEVEANATVIAAAPNMLAVCEALILTDDLQHAIDLARAVLAKLGKIANA